MRRSPSLEELQAQPIRKLCHDHRDTSLLGKAARNKCDSKLSARECRIGAPAVELQNSIVVSRSSGAIGTASSSSAIARAALLSSPSTTRYIGFQEKCSPRKSFFASGGFRMQ